MSNDKRKKNLVKIELKSDIKNLPALESTQLHFIATTKYQKKDDEYYYWKLKSNRLGKESTASTHIGSVLVDLPNFYYGSSLTMTVQLLSNKNFWEKLRSFCERIFIEEQQRRQIPQKELSFIPLSNPHPYISNTPNWYDAYSMEDVKEYYVSEYCIIYVPIIGINGKYVKGRFYVNDKPICEPLILQVESNAIQANCFIYRKDIGEATTAKLVFKLQPLKKGLFIPKNYLIPLICKTRKKRDVAIPYRIQEVIVGPLNIVENNFHPCKYTAIIVKELGPDENGNFHQAEIFNENVSSEVQPFPIIGNSEGKSIEITALNYKVGGKKCDKMNEHLPSDGKWNIEVIYKYTTPKPIVPLDCIWPISAMCITKYSLPIKSCRHNKKVLMNVYPDVIWGIDFSFSINRNEDNKSKWVVFFNLNMNCEWDSFKAEAELSQLALTGNNGSLKEYLKNTIYDQFYNYIETSRRLVEIYQNFIDIFESSQDDLKSQYKGKYQDLPIARRKMLTILLEPPNEVTLGLKWKTSVWKTNVGIKATGNGSGNLIKVSLKLDLLAVASKLNAGAAAFIATMDYALMIFDGDVSVNLVVEGAISLEGELSYDGAKKVNEGKVGLKGKIKAAIEGLFTLNAAQNTRIGTQYSIEGKGEWTAKLDLSPCDDGYKASLKIGFDGLEIIGKVEKRKEKANHRTGGKLKGGFSYVIIPANENWIKKEFYMINDQY